MRTGGAGGGGFGYRVGVMLGVRSGQSVRGEARQLPHVMILAQVSAPTSQVIYFLFLVIVNIYARSS